MAVRPAPHEDQSEHTGAASEHTPLLGTPTAAKALVTSINNAGVSGNDTGAVSDQSGGPTPAGPLQDDEDAPMPYTQVILLCFTATVDPVTYFLIFPIIGAMLVEVAGLPVKKIGLWSGLIETVFSMVQVLVMIVYGKIADRIGRKPVMIFSLLGIAASQALLGLAQCLWQMVLLRAMSGFFAGSSVCVRAMLSEITTKKTQARAFSWYMFARNVGIFVGPLIGQHQLC